MYAKNLQSWSEKRKERSLLKFPQTGDDAFLQLCITTHGMTDKAIDMFLRNCDHRPSFNRMAQKEPSFVNEVKEAYANMVEAQQNDYGEARASNALPGAYPEVSGSIPF